MACHSLRHCSASGNTVYCSYLGGSGYNRGSAIAVDSTGNIVVVGVTNSADFPTVNPLQEQVRDLDIFITKMDPTGLIYSTYLGTAAVKTTHP